MADQQDRSLEELNDGVPRSVRVSRRRWDKAKERAEGEGVTISRVAQELIEGYAEGMIDRPRMVFSTSATQRRSPYDTAPALAGTDAAASEG